MKVNFSVDEAVKKRYSVRNYSDKDISEELKKDIDAFVLQLDNPLGVKVHFHDLDLLTNSNDQKLGTYGVIKGARHYIGATVEKVPMALEALGYAFETLILYLAHKDIGTCWLGGTFDRKGFAAAHFDLLLRQKGKIGAFELMEGLENGLPQNMEYVFSWKPMI